MTTTVLNHNLLSATKWSFFSKIVVVFLGILKVSILARYISPSDFGLMALVLFFLGFTELFLDMGLSTAILFKQDISLKEYSSLYWFNIFFSLFLFSIIYLFSDIISIFFKEIKLNSLIPLMSLSILLSSIGRQFAVIQQKRLNFKFLGLVDILSAIVGFVITVYLSIIKMGVYALVFGSLSVYFVSNIIFLLYGLRTNGLIVHFDFKETKPFLRIGIFQIGGQVINFFTRDFDILIIGKIFGMELLGAYNLSKDIVRKPMLLFDPVVNKLASSTFPKFQDNSRYLRKLFSKLFIDMGIINAFTYGVIAILAPYIIYILYGHKFISLVTYVQLFSVLMFLRSMASLVGIMIITKGRTDLDLYWNIIISLFYPLAILIGSKFSLNMTIVSMIIIQFMLIIPGWFYFYKKTINLHFFTFIKTQFSPFLISLFWILVSLKIEYFSYFRFIVVFFLILSLLIYSLFYQFELKRLNIWLKIKY